jgi:hypothetical protein
MGHPQGCPQLFFLTEHEGFPPIGFLFDIRKRLMYTRKRDNKKTTKLKKQIPAMIA